MAQLIFLRVSWKKVSFSNLNSVVTSYLCAYHSPQNRALWGYASMTNAAAPVRRPNPANAEITKITKALSQWSRYVNGAIVAFVFALYAGERHIPSNSPVTQAEWHRFLWIVGSAVIALLLDQAQAMNNLIAYRRKQKDIERGYVRDVIFGKKQFSRRLSWGLFYAKLVLTVLNIVTCVILFGPIVSRWMPSQSGG